MRDEQTLIGDGSIRKKIREIIALHVKLDVQDLSDNQSLEDQGIDSLSLVEIIFALEETFDIAVPYNTGDPDLDRIYTSSLAVFVTAIEGFVAEQSPTI